jgi:uncharacterized protein (TIGR03435 family)
MHRAVCLSLFLIAPLSFLIAPLSAQAPPEFEVASLKPNTSGGRGFSIVPLPGGKLNATNITLKRLIAVAYSVTDFQIFGNVPWLESDRYDMEARAPGPAPLPQLRLMPRTLLEDRFKLTYHRETREMKIYSLTQVKPGTFGPGLVEIPNGECSAESTQQPALANGTPCDVVNMGAGRINGQRGRISQLCDRLSTLLAVTVVDKTGLQGNYVGPRPGPGAHSHRRPSARQRCPRPLGLYRRPGAAWTETRRWKRAGGSDRHRFGGKGKRELAGNLTILLSF